MSTNVAIAGRTLGFLVLVLVLVELAALRLRDGGMARVGNGERGVGVYIDECVAVA